MAESPVNVLNLRFTLIYTSITNIPSWLAFLLHNQKAIASSSRVDDRYAG
jgi:hypothetical protein